MLTRRIAAATFTCAAALVLAPAVASADTTDQFSVCPSNCAEIDTRGTITWYSRTARVSGSVTDTGPGYTQVIFRAYAGTRQIGHPESRTADDTGSVGSPRGFGFTMGDPDLVGGINKITVQLCMTAGGSEVTCTAPKAYTK